MEQRDLGEWMVELRRIKEVWAVAVAGMLSHADPGNPEICHALGNAYRHGHGVERDLNRAGGWYRKGALDGNTPSMVQLGLLLSRNEPTPEQLTESVEWFRRAADLGDSGGMIWVGFAFREGKGVPIDERTRPQTGLSEPTAPVRETLAYSPGNSSPTYSRIISKR